MNYILINYFDINDSSNIIIEGLTFTSFISSFEFFDRIVKTIKKALELISPGIL